MVRKVTFTVRPAPAIAALLTFAQATRTRRSGLGERLEREVRLGLECAARSLEAVLTLLRWLSRRGLARQTGFVDPSGLVAETTVAFDLRSAVAAALDQGSRSDGRAHADLYALRALARALRETELMSLDDVLLGRRSDTPRSLARAVEAACRETALADETVVPKAFRRVVPGAEIPPEVVGPPVETSNPAPRARGHRESRPTGSESPTPRPGGSFGGLPDDATSPPITPEGIDAGSLSPRGLTIDAEFFLESAGLKAWPCAAKVLARARRVVLVKLHPDRAGASSEERFRSAVKGFDDLAQVLAARPAPQREARAAATSPVTRPPTAAIGQWPPPQPVASVSADVAPSHPRQSFKRSSKA